MAEYDLPASFRYIFNITQRKINYIGHSLGTLTMFAALSKHFPEIDDNIAEIIQLGPFISLLNMKS